MIDERNSRDCIPPDFRRWKREAAADGSLRLTPPVGDKKATAPRPAVLSFSPYDHWGTRWWHWMVPLAALAGLVAILWPWLGRTPPDSSAEVQALRQEIGKGHQHAELADISARLDRLQSTSDDRSKAIIGILMNDRDELEQLRLKISERIDEIRPLLDEQRQGLEMFHVKLESLSLRIDEYLARGPPPPMPPDKATLTHGEILAEMEKDKSLRQSIYRYILGGGNRVLLCELPQSVTAGEYAKKIKPGARYEIRGPANATTFDVEWRNQTGKVTGITRIDDGFYTWQDAR